MIKTTVSICQGQRQSCEGHKWGSRLKIGHIFEYQQVYSTHIRYICVYVNKHTYIYTYIHVHMYTVCIYIYIPSIYCLNTWYTRILYIYILMYTYIYSYIHNYAYIHSYTFALVLYGTLQSKINMYYISMAYSPVTNHQSHHQIAKARGHTWCHRPAFGLS